LVHKVLKEDKVLRVQQVQLDLKELKDQKAHKDQWDHKVLKDQ
jgi:hypothetical protein